MPLRKTSRGFTLTELAIVLGIIGLILGAIWVAASKVYQSNRTDTAVKEIQTILSGYRSLYSTHAVDTGAGSWTDLTCVGVNSGFFPNDMIPPGTTCSAGNTASYPQHPWNSWLQVNGVQDWQAIMLVFIGLPRDACNSLAQQVSAAGDLVWEDINGTPVSLPPLGNGTPFTASQIAATCSAGNTNFIYFAFKAR